MFIDLIAMCAAAAAATWVLTRLLLPVAAPLGLVDHPVGRKRHADPTPLVGGIAVIVAVNALAWAVMDNRTLLPAFTLASLLLLAVGLLDDLIDLRWFFRIGAQATAALIMIYVGGVQIEQIGSVVGLRPMALGALSVPFTVFATVGLINAVNMIDGIDGLAGALVLSALAMLGGAALYSGNHSMLPLLLIMMGALIAFLAFNLRRPGVPRARTFMGNAGSAFLGFVIAWFSFRLTQNPGHPVSPVLPPFLILFPLLDCLALIARRLMLRRSPFSADRGHIHHLMLDAGFSHSQVVLTLTGLSLAVGLIAALMLKWNLPHPTFVAVFLVMLVVHYWVTASDGRAIRLFAKIRSRLYGQSKSSSFSTAERPAFRDRESNAP